MKGKGTDKKKRVITFFSSSMFQVQFKFVIVIRTFRLILKANLSWSQTWAKLGQLNTSWSVILQHNLTKLKLEFRKFDFKCEKKDINTDEYILHQAHLFSSSAQICCQDTPLIFDSTHFHHRINIHHSQHIKI